MTTPLVKINNIPLFTGKKVLVLGDVMLDSEIVGMVKRISPEAPVPIIHVQREHQTLGGAALVSHNIKNLGAEPYTLGVVGTDAAKQALFSLFNDLGISSQYLVEDPSRQTTEKIRYFGNGQHLLRLDHEHSHELSSEIEAILLHHFTALIPLMDIVVISDYGKGVVTKHLMDEILRLTSSHQKKIVVDGKPHKLAFYKGASVLTFNAMEAREIVPQHVGDDDRTLAVIAAEITQRSNAATIITRGKNGSTLCDFSGKVDHITGRSLEIADITGAGDAVTSVISLALAAHADLFTAAKLANYAAGVVVTKKGTATINADEMQKFLRLDIYEHLRESIRVKEAVIEKQIDKIEELAAMIIEAYKKGNKLLVFGNGGSAADAQHLAAEFVGRYKMERRGLPALALTTDSSILTSIGNDYGYEHIFSRQVEAHCNPGDIVLGITTSGNSPNVLKAFDVAKKIGAKTIVWTGRDGGEAAKVADVAIVVPSNNTPRIQEAHVALIHIICEIFEDHMHASGHF